MAVQTNIFGYQAGQLSAIRIAITALIATHPDKKLLSELMSAFASVELSALDATSSNASQREAIQRGMADTILSFTSVKDRTD
jgi:hypothetical protein